MMFETKTPKFKAALDFFYQSKKPGIYQCLESGKNFEISREEFELYKKLDIPLPDASIEVRFRRQRAYIGGLDLYRRITANSEMVCMYDPESEAKVMSTNDWYSDNFFALQYGVKYQQHRSFFEQWKNLYSSVPRPAIIHDINSQNSDWCLYDLSLKDCYFTFGGVSNENVYYSDFCVLSKFCFDCTSMARSEWCYDSVQCALCSETHFSERCESCIKVYFSFQCINCENCFGCTNLFNKKYCFFNEQLSETEYSNKLQGIDLTNPRVVDEMKATAKKRWQESPRKAGANYISENVQGDDLLNCSNVRGVSMFEGQRAYNCFDASYVKDCIDISTCSSLERSCNSISTISGYENKMNSTCEGCIDVEYSELCYNCEHCFGCVGLRNKKFCILNQQYSEKEYWEILDDIKVQMLKDGSYGRFFPYPNSLFAYNTSHADALYPINKNAALKLGARWYDFPESSGGEITLPPFDGMGENILQKNFKCKTSGRLFKIIKPELNFHQQFGLAFSAEHPTVRRKRRLQEALPIHLTKRNCDKCGSEISSRLPRENFSPVLCEECYSKSFLSTSK